MHRGFALAHGGQGALGVLASTVHQTQGIPVLHAQDTHHVQGLVLRKGRHTCLEAGMETRVHGAKVAPRVTWCSDVRGARHAGRAGLHFFGRMLGELCKVGGKP